MNTGSIYILYPFFPDDTTKTTVKKTTDTNHITEQQTSKPTIVQKNNATTPKVNTNTIATQPKVANTTTITTNLNDTLATDTIPQHPPYIYQVQDTIACNNKLFPIDSLIGNTESIYHESIFKNHEYTVQSFRTTPRHQTTQPSWFFITLLLVSFLAIGTIRFFKENLYDIAKATIDKNKLKLLFNKKLHIDALVNLLYSSLLSLVISLTMSYFGFYITSSQILDYLIIVSAIFLFLALRILLMKLLGNVFQCKESINAYISNVNIFNLLSSLILIILVLMVAYSTLPISDTLVVSGIFIASMFVLKFLRGVSLILSESQFLKFYLLYYSIIIEIAPLLIIGKITISNM